jgi:tetrahedral aminopeptidase
MQRLNSGHGLLTSIVLGCQSYAIAIYCTTGAAIMERDSWQLLKDILLTPSPSGNEQDIQRLIHERMSACTQLIEPDVYGNLVMGVNTSAKFRVLLDGHCDQIGFTVKHISEDGFIFVEPLGGIDESVLLGTKVFIHSLDGPIQGVFGKKAVHLQSVSETTQVPKPESMWIDVGARQRSELEQVVPLGTYVTFELGITELRNDRIMAPGLDNKAGLFVILEALRRCCAEPLNVALYASSSAQEELGLRGAGIVANRLDPGIAITVDVMHAVDDPGITDKTVVPCKLGGGPCISWGPNTNPVVAHRLKEAAVRRQLPFQTAPRARLAGNDSKKIQVSGTGVATANIGIPNRNMHTQAEICSLSDLSTTIELLVEFLTSLPEEPDLTPLRFPQYATAI